MFKTLSRSIFPFNICHFAEVFSAWGSSSLSTTLLKFKPIPPRLLCRKVTICPISIVEFNRFGALFSVPVCSAIHLPATKGALVCPSGGSSSWAHRGFGPYFARCAKSITSMTAHTAGCIVSIIGVIVVLQVALCGQP